VRSHAPPGTRHEQGTLCRSVKPSRFPVFHPGPRLFTLSEVSQFLVEVYLSQLSAGIGSPGPDDVSWAADHLTRQGSPVRLLCSVFVPEDETGLYLFEAQSPEVVVEVAARCGLRFERIVEARSAWTSQPATSTTISDQP
jgi:hypothetical protein